jgi:hypothetical protein
MWRARNIRRISQRGVWVYRHPSLSDTNRKHTAYLTGRCLTHRLCATGSPCAHNEIHAPLPLRHARMHRTVRISQGASKCQPTEASRPAGICKRMPGAPSLHCMLMAHARRTVQGGPDICRSRQFHRGMRLGARCHYGPTPGQSSPRGKSNVR